MQFTDLHKRRIAGTESIPHVTNGVHSAFNIIVRALGGTPTSLFRPLSMFGDALDLPLETCNDFPRPRAWEAAVDRYRALFTAFGIRAHDLLFRLLDRKL